MARNASIFDFSIQQWSDRSKFQASLLASFLAQVYSISIYLLYIVFMIHNYVSGGVGCNDAAVAS